MCTAWLNRTCAGSGAPDFTTANSGCADGNPPTSFATLASPAAVFRLPWHSTQKRSSVRASCTRPRCSWWQVAQPGGGVWFAACAGASWHVRQAASVVCALNRGRGIRGVRGSLGSTAVVTPGEWHASHFCSAKACARETGPALYGGAVAGRREHRHPEQRRERQRQRQQDPPAPHAAGTREVIEIDALGELLGGSYSHTVRIRSARP